MKITVAICTWNRADLLSKTLENMLRLKTDDSFTWELIIVNNNCTDNTDQIIEQFSDRLPIRRISEPTPGLSNARNAAVQNATGDYIVWTDDDVLVDENWLVAYIEAFKRYPEAAVFGGPVLPWFEGEPPKWLLDGWELVESAFAVRNLGDQEFELIAEQTSSFPFGANYAIKTITQKACLYNHELGLNAGKIVLGEETAVIKRILQNDNKGWWIPDVKVRHWLPKDRQSMAYLKKYFIGVGETRAIENQMGPCAHLLGIPRWLIRKYSESVFTYYFKKMFNKKKSLEYLMHVYILRGQINYFYKKNH